MKRLDFLGLNANQTACVFLFGIAVLWTLNFSARRLYVKVILMAMEAALIVAVGMTMSRGGVVILLCASLFMRYLYKRHGMVGKWRWRNVTQSAEPAVSSANRPALLQKIIRRIPMIPISWQPVLRWACYSPVWRVALVLCNSGLWGRSLPDYLIHDASIGNRFELWEGAMKLISASPLRGWGFENTGAAYMNWFQDVNNHTYYKGLVNSFFQIAAAYGLPALFGVLFASLTGVLCLGRITDRANRPGEPLPAGMEWNLKKAIWVLCFLWLIIWGIGSCFSTMLSSMLLLVPPALAIPTMLCIQPPRKVVVLDSFVISFALCFLIFALGCVLARSDSMAIKRDNHGMVTIAQMNNEANSGRSCIIYADEEAIGSTYGKELRKFLDSSHFEKCMVVDRKERMIATFEAVELVILSGIAVSHIEIQESALKYILLNPAFLPNGIPEASIHAIIYPEINRLRLLQPAARHARPLQSKIHVVPFDERFETSWSEFIDL